MLKSLTLWEPYASLLATGQKRIETRHWPTDYRGPVAIHAAKGGLTLTELWSTCSTEPFLSALKSSGVLRSGMNYKDVRNALPFGHVIAVGILSDCFRTDHLEVRSKYLPLNDQERAFGNYAPGRFGFVFTEVARLTTPVPFKSRQGGLIELDRTAELAVRDQWWQRCCPCPVESHILTTHEVERGEHFCKGCNSRHDYRKASH